MLKNKNGFIALSLIYSFFLIFLICMLAIVTDYAQNRILLNDVKKVTKEKLNELTEYDSVFIPYKNYKIGDTVSYANETWLVMEDDGDTLKLILKRELNNSELSAGLSKIGLSASNSKILKDDDAVTMCLNGYSSNFCSYLSSNILEYNQYYWDDSIPKKILDYWFDSSMHLQKALSKGALISMNYSDGLQNYSDYIRIPVNGEYNDSSIWNLTYNTINSGISYVKVNNSSVSTHDNFLKIKPIIKVYKESETLKRISRLETEVQIREAQITSLQADIEINKGNTAVVSSLQSQINTLNSEIDNLNIQIEELRVSLPAS